MVLAIRGETLKSFSSEKSVNVAECGRYGMVKLVVGRAYNKYLHSSCTYLLPTISPTPLYVYSTHIDTSFIFVCIVPRAISILYM